MLRYFYIALIFISCTKTVSNLYRGGTSIVVARGKSGICVASDSRRVFHIATNGLKFGILKYDTVCKIKQARNLFYCSAGFDVDPVDAIAENCILTSTSIKQAADLFLKKAGEYRINYLEKLRLTNRKDFEYYFENLKHFGSALFGFENGIPKIVEVTFTITSKKNEKVVVKDSTNLYLTSPTTNTFIFLGASDNNFKFAKDSIFWKTKGFQKGMEELVAIECDRDSINVGRPIDVLGILGETKYIWFKGPGCKNKKH
jgi:hypothetical protein